MATAPRHRIVTEGIFVEKMAEESSPMRVAVESLLGESGGGIRAGDGPPVRLSTIPGPLANQRRDQQSTYSQDNVSTAPDGTFYSVVLEFQGIVDTAGVKAAATAHAVVRKHAPSGRVLQSFDLHTLSGNPFGDQGDDSHNTWVVGVDHLGNILVAGNTRGTPLKMARTTIPGDLSTMTFVASPLPSAYSDLTYPTLVRKGNGRLAFAAGQGYAAGGRMWFWAEWNGAAFGAPQNLVDGTASNEGAYLHRFAIRGNRIGLFFMWRNGTTGDRNADLGYVESRDGGITWVRRDGTPQQMPVTHANADTIVPFAFGSGALNQGGGDIDNDGNPHCAILFYDAVGATQLHHVWHDGTQWHNDRVTDLTRRMELASGTIQELSVARPQLFCTNGGRTYILARMTYDGLGGRPVAIDVTPGADNTPFRLADLDLSGWEPAYDGRALREHNTLRMLVTSIDHAKSSKLGWVAQWGGILSIDLDRLGQVEAGAARIPTIKTVAAYGILTELATIANTTADTVIAELGQVLIPGDQYTPGAVYFLRVQGEFNLRTSAGAYIAFTDTINGGELCRLNLIQQSVASRRATPWEPIPVTLQPAAASARTSLAITAHGSSTATPGGVQVKGYRVEVGLLDWT